MVPVSSVRRDSASTLSADAKALRMIDCIYRAASEPSHWYEFARQLSDAYDGAAVSVGMALDKPVPNTTTSSPAYLGISAIRCFRASSRAFHSTDLRFHSLRTDLASSGRFFPIWYWKTPISIGTG